MRRNQILNLTNIMNQSKTEENKIEETETDGKQEKEKLLDVLKRVSRDDDEKRKDISQIVQKKEDRKIDNNLTLDDCCNIINFITNEPNLQNFIAEAKSELEDGTKSEIIIYALTLLIQHCDNC